MAAILLALYDDHAAAQAIRDRLVHEGFPTDRVRLTSRNEPGQAGSVPAASREGQFHRYFRSLFDGADKVQAAELVAYRVSRGAAAVTVHPRGEPEIALARHILESGAPLELGQEHLDDTLMEHAAATEERPYLVRVLQRTTPDPH